MDRETFPAPRPSAGLGEIISDASIRRRFDDLLGLLEGLHERVTVSIGNVDVRVEYDGKLLCRVVPYRELIHLQIGDSPTWEIRVGNDKGYAEAVDRILKTFLSMAAHDWRLEGRRNPPPAVLGF